LQIGDTYEQVSLKFTVIRAERNKICKIGLPTYFWYECSISWKVQDLHDLNTYTIVCLFTYNDIKLNYEQKSSVFW